MHKLKLLTLAVVITYNPHTHSDSNLTAARLAYTDEYTVESQLQCQMNQSLGSTLMQAITQKKIPLCKESDMSREKYQSSDAHYDRNRRSDASFRRTISQHYGYLETNYPPTYLTHPASAEHLDSHYDTRRSQDKVPDTAIETVRGFKTVRGQ